MRFSERILIALATVGATFVFAGPALADNSCPSGACQTVPATATTTTSSNSSSQSHVKIVVKKTTVARVRQYEKAHRVHVAISGGTPMSGAGCVDPTTQSGWGVYNGEAFFNADRFHRELPDNWRKGWEICGWHVVKNWHGHKGVWVVGTKMNCRNTPIAIPIKQTKPPRVKTRVVEWTVKHFTTVYEKWVKKETSSTSTTTTSTTYSCSLGWTLSGTQCKLCPPPPSCPPSPPTVTPPLATNITLPQEVYVNETYNNFCSDVYSLAGDDLVVTFGMDRGVGSTVEVFASFTGKTHVCGSITAGSEPGTATVSVVVHDKTTNQTSDTVNPPSVSFPILSQLTRP